MISGETKSIADVVVGDSILVTFADSRKPIFSDVIAIPHARNNLVVEIQHIWTSAKSDIKMTADHLLPAGACSSELEMLPLIRAADVKQGECIETINGRQEVATNSVEQVQGIYTVVTAKGDYLVVNGVIASPFAINHGIGHAFYTVHRYAYAYAPSLLKSALMVSFNAVAANLAAYFSK